jgi:hypothetical protein
MIHETTPAQRSCVYRVLRYAPNGVRDEWLNIGVLLYDPKTGERRLRMIEEQDEFARVRRLHPQADEGLLRGLRHDLEDRLGRAAEFFTGDDVHAGENGHPGWLKLLEKWDQTLSNTLQLAVQKGVYADDLDAEMERLYADQVAPVRGGTRVGAPGSRGAIRAYCAQVWKAARLWDRIEKAVRAEEFTFPGDPMRIDYGYRRSGTRGFVQALSVSRSPGDVKSLAYTVERIRQKVRSSEFAAVTDVHLAAGNGRHKFVEETLRDAGIEAVPLEGFAVWTAKLRPQIQ